VDGALNAVSCPSTRDCVVVDKSSRRVVPVIWVRCHRNGGTSWVTEKVPSGVAGLWTISCPSTKDCVAVGVKRSSAPTVVATTNGGVTWVTEKVPSGVAGLGTISCPSMKDCFVVADNPAPTVIATRNANHLVTEKLPSLV